MNRREFLLLAGRGCVGAACCSALPLRAGAQANATRPPNIVFILIDDMGWADVGCFGSTFHETPNIDRLAAQGMRFTDAYAACPVCSPTRASIMTGKYPTRLNLTNFIKGTRSPEDSPILTAEYADELPLAETTLPEALKHAGYVSGHFGKWHLGNEGFGPLEQGFDVNVAGGRSGMPKSFYWPEWGNNPELVGKEQGEYLTDRLSLEACAFIDANADKPFFVHLAHYSVHIPLEGKPEKVAKYEAKLAANPQPEDAQNNPVYAAMVESVDESVGRVMDALERNGIAENTIVVFFSDNGGLSVEELGFPRPTSNAPWRDGKGYLYEGGIREPMIVRWPSVVEAGSVCDTPVCSVDFFPTFCELAGIDLDDVVDRELIDGVNILPLFRNADAELDRDALYWHYPHFSNQGGRPGGVIRRGDWKLIERYEDGSLELYDLGADPSEGSNLAEVHPRRANRLRNRLESWRLSVNANMPKANPKYVASS